MNKPYAHPYGGTALDQEVTAECFAQTFGTTVAHAATFATDEKVGDRCVPNGEILGYVHENKEGHRRYVVTLIQRSR